MGLLSGSGWDFFPESESGSAKNPDPDPRKKLKVQVKKHFPNTFNTLNTVHFFTSPGGRNRTHIVKVEAASQLYACMSPRSDLYDPWLCGRARDRN